LNTETDIIGKALLDYQSGNYSENIITYSSVAGRYEMAIPLIFRTYDEMPEIEKRAMELCRGSILDVGCGSGSHALFLQNKGHKVKAIDISRGAIETCKLRDVKNSSICNIWDIKFEKFDTILALMNGVGMCETMAKLGPFLSHLKSLLKPNGQILLDSSDIIYMYDEPLKERLIRDNENYYGEVIFEMVYKGEFSPHISWLFLDLNTLKSSAKKAGLNCELIQEGLHYDFLVSLTINNP